MGTNKFAQIRTWANNRGIYKHGDSKTQMLKLQEEVGELAQAILKRKDADVYDAIGDCVVVLTNVIELYELERARLEGSPVKKMTIEACIQAAYDVIATRSGKMQNGTFVKDA